MGKCERKLHSRAEADTFPEGGENVRGSKLSEDLAQATRKWPIEKSRDRPRRYTLL